MILASPAQDSAPPEVLTSDLCWLLGRANHLLNAEFTTALESCGISPRQHSVLATALTGEHTQTDLARLVGLDKTTLMVTLDDLERAGLAERRPLPSDRRARVVAVTPAGERTMRDAEAAMDRARDEVLALLPAEDRQGFLESLGRLACSHQSADAGCVGPPAAGGR